jgi:microcystin-dependent protein
MKPSSIFKLTALVILISFSKTSLAQITTTGMAIQGIARDASNNAITNTAIGIKFTVHYTNSSNANVDLSPVTVSLTTDAFGVFSYVLDMSAIETSLFYDFQMKLKIEQTSPSTTLISDENLNFVPYAVSASNGVPTGTIIAYVGSEAPRGWAKCEGQVLPTSAVTLRALLNSANAPDLRGMFLRGAGLNGNVTYASNVGPDLKTFQADGIKSHALTVTDNGHIHGITDPGHRHNSYWSGDDDSFASAFDMGESRDALNASESSTTGISINSATTGISVNYAGLGETRPVNYGVTYIIKL